MQKPVTILPSTARLLAAVALLSLAGACDDDPPPPVRDAPADAPIDAGTPDTTPDGAAPDVTTEVMGEVSGDVPAGETGDGGAGDTGEAAPPPPPPALHYAVVRLNPNGTPDTTFGTAGIARVPAGEPFGNVNGASQALYGIAGDAMGRVVLFGLKKGLGADPQDRVVMRLTAAGALDTTFGTNGEYRMTVGTYGDNVRNGVVQADGKILSAGYTNQPTNVGTQSTNRIVLLRLDIDGKPDPTFGMNGLVNDWAFVPPAGMMYGMAEAYGVAIQKSGSYVTTGYGYRMPAASMTPTDVVSLRYGPDGKRDLTFGGTADGASVVDHGVGSDRGRNLVGLDDDRIVVVGSAQVGTATSRIDAYVVRLLADGKDDTTFDTDGRKTYAFDRPEQAFFGAALSPDKKWVLATGYRAGNSSAGPEDDDAVLLLLPVDPAGTEVAKAVPLDESTNDRFWAAAFDANGKAYGAGFVRQGGDHLMAVARYNADGTLDATFGTAGVAKINVQAGGTVETARGIVVQADGKILIGGPVEAP